MAGSSFLFVSSLTRLSTVPKRGAAQFPRLTQLNSQQVWLQFYVSVLLGPEVSRHRGQFVHDRHGVTVLGEVHRFDVMAAGIACLDSNVLELISRVNRELLNCFLTARGAYDSPICPFRRAHRANQRSLCAIAFRPQHTYEVFRNKRDRPPELPGEKCDHCDQPGILLEAAENPRQKLLRGVRD